MIGIRRELVVVTALFGLVCQGCGVRLPTHSPSGSSGSGGSRSSTDTGPTRVTGTISLETTVSESKVAGFTSGEEGEPKELPVSTTTGGNGDFTLDVDTQSLDIPENEPLIIMSKVRKDSGDFALWSYADVHGKKNAKANLNSLTSIAYEFAVQEKDLARIKNASHEVAKFFRIPAEGLRRLRPDHPKVARTGKLVRRVAEQTAATVWKVHSWIAFDLRDGALDGTYKGRAVSLGGDADNAAVLAALRTIIRGENPDWQHFDPTGTE